VPHLSPTESSNMKFLTFVFCLTFYPARIFAQRSCGLSNAFINNQGDMCIDFKYLTDMDSTCNPSPSNAAQLADQRCACIDARNHAMDLASAQLQNCGNICPEPKTFGCLSDCQNTFDNMRNSISYVYCKCLRSVTCDLALLLEENRGRQCVFFQGAAAICSAQSGIGLLINGISNFCAVATTASLGALASVFTAAGYNSAADAAATIAPFVPKLCTGATAVTSTQAAGIALLGLICRQGADVISQGIYDNCLSTKRAFFGTQIEEREIAHRLARRDDQTCNLLSALKMIAGSSGLSDFAKGNFNPLFPEVSEDDIFQVQSLIQSVNDNMDGVNALVTLAGLATPLNLDSCGSGGNPMPSPKPREDRRRR